LLSGKLISQGSGSVLDLCQKWRTNASTALDDEYLSALCHYVFDERFRKYLGPQALALLSVIASYESFGVDEESVRSAAGFSEVAFGDLLDKLLQVKCIDRGLVGGMSVLKMHPITQAYFRAFSP
jgi:hypothetical protein